MVCQFTTCRRHTAVSIDTSLSGSSRLTALATFKVCYHMIEMLSCRAGHVGSMSYLRRSAAADAIQHILSEVKVNRLLPIPMVPYSVSLALTVAYRDLRDGNKPVPIAVENISFWCESLETIGSNWPTANTMARLGRAVLARSEHQSNSFAVASSNGSTSTVKPGPHNFEEARNTNHIGHAGNQHLHDARHEAIPNLDNRLEKENAQVANQFQSQNGHSVPPTVEDPLPEPAPYDDLDSIFGSMLDTSWMNMSQDLIDFGDLTGDASYTNATT